MFILHSSNKTENLLQHLLAVLNSAPLSSPLAAEVFLIQSQGMERWLSQQLATRLHVWANFQYLFPAKFFDSVAQSLHARFTDNPFDRTALLWHIEALLRDIGDEVYQPLRYFLSGENIDLKRFQLAQQLTRIFDQYQILRPDWLTAWQQGQQLFHTANEAWQQSLWKILTQKLGSEHRGAQWQHIIELLQDAPEGNYTDLLPERIMVFGINTMPPLLLAYLQALAKHCDVHVFLFNPVQIFWADLPSKRLLSQLTDFDGHPLLVSLGQQGREFQQLLLEQSDFAFEPSSFEAGDETSILNYVQNDILNNQVRALTLNADHSISIHACHSRLREVQVLKNQLLASLENSNFLELKDIVVMAPDIQQYAPFIAAVFSDIPHAIADRSLRISNLALNVFLSFLNLSQSRLGWQSVLDLLEQPPVRQNFSLTEADSALIRHWLNDTQVRWGQSAAHKQTLGLPAFNQNTWQASLERLFMGYAVGNTDSFVDDILPYPDLEGSSAQALGGLNDLLQLLFKASA
jgi:exodeoxyribonuclease V gamma subunit